MYRRITNFRSPTMTTISLVQGDALGGGFEAALTSDVIVAEESAQMGLPEILFNLFPGMGAYSLLARRIGMRAAEELILSGKMLPANELHKMGIVDVLATDGQGETAVRNWIAKNAKRRNGMQAVFNARQYIHPVTREELDGIVEPVGRCRAAPHGARTEDDDEAGARAVAAHGVRGPADAAGGRAAGGRSRLASRPEFGSACEQRQQARPQCRVRPRVGRSRNGRCGGYPHRPG